MRAYVAAPFIRFREAAFAALALGEIGVECSSRWIEQAIRIGGKEALTPGSAEIALAVNDSDVRKSEAVLALVYPGQGRSMFGEARYASSLGLPVFWVLNDGVTEHLDMYRSGASRHVSIQEAVEAMGKMGGLEVNGTIEGAHRLASTPEDGR